MKVFTITLLCFFIGCPLYADISALFERRLAQNLSYQRALLQYEQARYQVTRLEKSYIPYLSISGGRFSVGSPEVNNGEDNGETTKPLQLYSSLGVSVDAVFENVFGTDITISAPFSWDVTKGYTPELPKLTVSRELFDQRSISLVKAKAELATKRTLLMETEHTVMINLIKDIFDYRYYLAYCEIQSEYEQNYKTLISVTRDERSIRDLKRKRYTALKTELETETVLAALTAADSSLARTEIEHLYEEIMEMAGRWEQRADGLEEVSRRNGSLEALRLSLVAAEKEEAFWFLPYLPNPTISAGVSYDIDRKALDWSFSIQFQADILDRGERSIESLQRKKGFTLARLELDKATEDIRQNADRAERRKEILEIEYTIALLNKEEKHEAFTDAEQLHQEGFLSREDFELRSLDYRNALLAVERAHHLYLLQLLELFKMHGIAWFTEEVAGIDTKG